MVVLHLMLLTLVPAQAQVRYPLAYVYQIGMESLLEGDHERALEAFTEIMNRMPHDGRARYDAAGVLFELGSYAEADTLVSAGNLAVESDSAASASYATLLGSSIAMDDYEGVQSSFDGLRELLSGGESRECDRTNYEVALNWLRNHEPPEEQGDGESDGDSDDQSDQSEDSEDSQDDQSDDGEDSHGSDDQSEDQEDQSEDQEDQSEDQEDQSEDQEDQEASPPPPPSRGEMSEEDAERILELVEEAEPPESSEGGKAYVPGGPVW